MKWIVGMALCIVAGWYGNNLVRDHWPFGFHVEITYAKAQVAKSVAYRPTPKTDKAAKRVPAPVHQDPAPASGNNELWRVHGTVETSPFGYCAGWGSCLHGNPRN